jgi:hypothetical protein
VFLARITHGQTILALICLGCFIISLIINYPGFMSADSFLQLLEARPGVYSDWHPPSIAFIWHFIEGILPGSLGMFILETSLIWMGTFLVTLYWFNKKRFTVFGLFPSLIVFYPPLFGTSGAIWQDNLIWALLMLAIGGTGSLEPFSATRRWAICVTLTMITSVLFMAMLTADDNARFAAVPFFAAVPIMILSIVRVWGTSPPVHRIAVSSAAGLMICVLLQFCALQTTEYLATYKTSGWTSLVLFDVAGIIYRMPDHQQQQTFYAQIPARLQGPGSLEGLLETYDPTTSDRLLWSPDGNTVEPTAPGKQPGLRCVTPLNNEFNELDDAFCFDLTDKEKGSLLQLWSTLVMHYPLAWLSHKMSVFRRNIGRHHWDYVYMEQEPAYWAPRIYGQPAPKLNWLQTRVKSLIARVSVHVWPLYMPLSYLVLTIVTISACFLSYTEERLQIALIAASGLSQEMGVFLLAFGNAYRHSHYMIYTSVIALLLLLQTYLMDRRRRFPIRTYLHRRRPQHDQRRDPGQRRGRRPPACPGGTFTRRGRQRLCRKIIAHFWAPPLQSRPNWLPFCLHKADNLSESLQIQI